MAYSLGALRRDAPDIQGGFHEFFSGDGVFVGQVELFAFCFAESAPELAFAGHYHTLSEITQHRIGSRAERPPCARTASPLSLQPDDLGSQEEADVFQNAHHIC